MNDIKEFKTDFSNKFLYFFLFLLIISFIGIVILFFVNKERSLFNLLILLILSITISTGSLFWVAVEYLTNAVWSVPIRRVFEFNSSILIITPLLSLPIILNFGNIFNWYGKIPENTSENFKFDYLNLKFFSFRFFLIFISIFIVSLLIRSNSNKQDNNKNILLTKKNINLSAIFMIIYAISITIFSIDWIMSLEYKWFSTIFGVHIFSGSIIAGISLATVFSIILNENKKFPFTIKKDHYYNLGLIQFAFICFWAYISFCQFFLIWYGNIPEETRYFLKRWNGDWKYISILLIFIHFIIPFFALLRREDKMKSNNLLFSSVWILFSHFFEIYWLVFPVFSPFKIVFGLNEIISVTFYISITIILFLICSRKNNIFPINDPKLENGINFKL